MSAEVESIDDLLLNLTAMGFDPADCQDAISAGLLSVAEAVEWILNGKPGNQQQPTLQLRKTTNSIFDCTGLAVNQPSTTAPSPPMSPTTHSLKEQPDIKVASKRTEMQRQQWDKFHEKQRAKAELSAKLEKSEKQKAHLEILQQITMDKKERLQSASNTLPEIINSATNSHNNMTSHTGENTEKHLSPFTTIQVRCPNGTTVKSVFDQNDHLDKLCHVLREKFPDMEEMALLQPFPRREFLTEDFNKSFSELNLVPSGSLVLNTVSSSRAKENSNTRKTQERRPSPLSSSRLERNLGRPPLVHVPDYRRQHFDGDIQNELQGFRDRRDGVPQMHAPPLPNLMAEMHQVLENAGLGHVWGSGQKLSGDQMQDDNAAHRNANPLDLAREAALQRADHQVMGEPGLVTHMDHSVSLLSTVTVPSLVNQSMNIIVKRLNNPVVCSATVLNLPSDLARRILEHMKKELVLSPRTLQPFLSCHLNSVVLDFYPYATNELLYALRLHTTIQHLSLASCSLINDGGLVNLKYLKRLLSLNLRECNQITDSAFQIFSELSHLTSLNLEGTKITDAGLQNYVHGKPINLQHLNLSRTPVTDKALESVSELINLKSLGLDETQIKCLHHLCPLQQLESLSLRSTPVSWEALVCLGDLPNLNSLNIAQLPFVEGDKALELIQKLQLNVLQLPSRLTTSDYGLRCISGMHLTSLDLANYINITDDGVKCLGNMTSLKVLMLSNTKTTDNGLLALHKLHHLEILYLDRTLITDFGTSIFKGMPKLTELSLASTSTGKKCLTNGNLNYNSLLNKLNLNNTHINDKGLRQLSLPNLTIISLDGTRLRSDPHLLLTGCPQLKHISAKNIEPRGRFDSDDED